MEVYLLEIYENSSANVPDFGLVFKNMDLLLKFVSQHIKKLQPENIEYAENLKDTGLALSLDEEETVRVTILPVIEDVDNDKYDEYLTGKRTKENDKKEHNKDYEDNKHNKHKSVSDDVIHTEEDDEVEITESGETIELPPGSENTITKEELKDGDVIVDFFRNKDRKGNPRYILKGSYDKLKSPKHDPWTVQPIHEATTYKIKIAKNNSTKKNNKNKNKNETRSEEIFH